MENNPDMESFERFIKQQSDDFRMYPTKRVWYSLYNNLHPSRKWPSISMCILLLTTLFLIGFLNTNNNHSQSATTAANTADNQKSIATAGNNNIKTSGTTLAATVSAEANTAKTPLENTVVTSVKTSTSTLIADKNTTAAVVVPGANRIGKLTTDNAGGRIKNHSKTVAQNAVAVPDASTGTLVDIQSSEAGKTTAANASENIFETVPEAEAYGIQPGAGNTEASNLTNAEKLQVVNSIINPSSLLTASVETTPAVVITDADLQKPVVTDKDQAALTESKEMSPANKSWIENYALYNKPAPKKWKGKLAWQAYFTPSVSYRKLFNNAAGKDVIPGAIVGPTDASLSKEVTQSASLGLEAGIGLQYPIFKGVKIKAGVQLNYTRYNISAFENSHPTITSLEMLSEINGKPYELYKNTAYSNNAGLIPVTLHNQTFQLSIPVGADVKLAGNDLFEWYAGAAIQPTIVIAASSYLISTDRRNYVKDNSMLNRFNMNAAFETYISFKSAGGLTWQIGPQLRKQLYTTNSKFFTVEEKLMGYGLKIGFTKKL